MYRARNKGDEILYADIIAVTNRHLSPRSLLEQIEIICQHKPSGILLREKDLPCEEYCKLASEVLGLCKRYQVPCTLHNYVEAARKLQCSRIHLPLPILRQTKLDSEFSVVGTSVHSIEEVKEAINLQVTYIMVGHIFDTDCKKGLPPRGIHFLSDICSQATVPVYAIGGIHVNEQEIDSVKRAGASKVCIMSDMMKLDRYLVT